MDPATGENLWTFREPATIRHQRSPRQAYGKGVAYAEVNGRGVIYITTPGFFLWPLDAKTGRPLENWGEPVPLDGFAQTGAIDPIPWLVEDWDPWQDYVVAGDSYDADYGIPPRAGHGYRVGGAHSSEWYGYVYRPWASLNFTEREFRIFMLQAAV